MVGGLLQLKEKGAQDLYLTGQPQITFFKTVYRRHTNFSVESIEQLFDIPPSKDATCRVDIDRKGDLISTFIGKQEERKIRNSINQLESPAKSREEIINADFSLTKENKNNEVTPLSHG